MATLHHSTVSQLLARHASLHRSITCRDLEDPWNDDRLHWPIVGYLLAPSLAFAPEFPLQALGHRAQEAGRMGLVCAPEQQSGVAGRLPDVLHLLLLGYGQLWESREPGMAF